MVAPAGKLTSDMATLTLAIALMLTAISVLLTSILASRYGINDESVFFED